MQTSGPWNPWLPVVENSRLFAQRTVCPQDRLHCIGGLSHIVRTTRARDTDMGVVVIGLVVQDLTSKLFNYTKCCVQGSKAVAKQHHPAQRSCPD